MPNGTVKFFNAAKGFGFITSDEGRKDVFVPAASISAAGLSTLKTGQRVLYDEVADGKGPKASNLKLLEPAVARVDAMPKHNTSVPWTLYCDMSFEESEEVLAGLRAAGHNPRVVDYIAAPPNRDELKRLAALLRGADQSLVRKYDHLFGELRLDDRFISENDFWDAVVEHPSLINGPVVTTIDRACICHSLEALQSFLASHTSDSPKPAIRQKTLSPRLLSLMKGEVPAPATMPETEKPVPGPVAKETTSPAKIIAAANLKPATPNTPKPTESKASVKAEAKTKAGKKVASKSASVAKPAKSATNAAKKPLKKPGKR